MKVLVACEFSGIVRDAFEKKGHDVTSCDFLPSERKGNHYQGDVMDIINDGWDMMIAFPPCTYLSASGLHWNKRVSGREEKTLEALDFVKKAMSAPIEKIALENPIGRISTAIRKPEQIIQAWMFGHNASKQTCLWLKNLPKLVPTKIIPPNGWKIPKYASEMPLCPYCEEEAFCTEHDMHFAECDCIGTTQDDVYYRIMNGYLFGKVDGKKGELALWDNQTPSGRNKLTPSPTRWMERSRTYQGIAEAMSEQWK